MKIITKIKPTELEVLRAVATLELAKGGIVLLAGCGVISMVHRDAWDVAESLLRFLHVSSDHHYAQVFLNLADRVNDLNLWAVAAFAAIYSTLRFIEAYGLWKARVWAEWFALISGAVYLPFEVFELVRKPTPIRAAILLINLAVVLYMLYLRMSARNRAGRMQPV